MEIIILGVKVEDVNYVASGTCTYDCSSYK